MANLTRVIQIEHHPSPERLNQLGVWSWGLWKKEVSSFPWQYDIDETCYFLEGEVIITPEGSEPVRISKGDLVRFTAGFKCTWEICQAVEKYYCFE